MFKHKKTYYILVVGILLLIQSFESMAQLKTNFRFVNYGKKDGLSTQYIYDAVQDKNGYMYFGTDIGLFQFDGYRFKKIESPTNIESNSSNSILYKLFIDDRNQLWCSSVYATQILNLDNMEFFETANLKSQIKSKQSLLVRNINKSIDGLLLCTRLNDLFQFHFKDSSMKKLIEPNNAGRLLNAIYFQNMDVAIYDNKIVRFNHSTTKQIDELSFPTYFKGIINHTVLSKNELYLNTISDGVYVYNITSNQLKKLSPLLNSNHKENVLSFSIFKNHFFYGSDQLEIIDTLTKQRKIIKSNFENFVSLTSERIQDIFVDREGNLWLLGIEGLSMMPWQNQQIQEVSLNLSGNEKSSPTRMLQEKKSKDLFVVLNNENKLLRFDKNFIHCKEIKLTEPIYSIIQLENGRILCSGLEQNQFELNPISNTLKKLSIKNQEGKEISFGFKNFKVNEHTIINSNLYGGYKFIDLTTNKAFVNSGEIVIKSENNNDSIKTNIFLESQDKDGNFWFGGKVGVHKLDIKTNTFKSFAYEINKKCKYIIRPQNITQDAKGHIWISTVSDKLFELIETNSDYEINMYSKDNHSFYTSASGTALQFSTNDNCLYFTSTNGITKFNTLTKKQESTFDIEQGMPTRNPSIQLLIGDSSILYSLHQNKLIKINLAEYKLNTSIPIQLFTSIKILEHNYALEWQKERDKLFNFNATQNYVQFEFSSMQHNNTEQCRYYYQLSKVDSVLKFNGTNNTINYSNLSYGNYTLTVIGTNSDGVKGKPITFKFKINAPFYFTWWFIGGSIFLLGSSIFAFYRLKINQFKKEETLKTEFYKEIASIEMKALRAQMNPHFIFNCLNSIQKYILSNQHFEASQYLTKFSRLIRLILDHAKEDYISLESEIELIKIYVELEKMRFDKGFDFELIFDSKLKASSIYIPSMLIQPYIENAIWHGLLHKDGIGKLELEFLLLTESLIQVNIIDNGIGRKKANELKSKNALQKKSYGMKITEERIQSLNKLSTEQASATIIDLKNEMLDEIGTQVRIILPIKLNS